MADRLFEIDIWIELPIRLALGRIPDTTLKSVQVVLERETMMTLIAECVALTAKVTAVQDSINFEIRHSTDRYISAGMRCVADCKPTQRRPLNE